MACAVQVCQIDGQVVSVIGAGKLQPILATCICQAVERCVAGEDMALTCEDGY
jgi:hypothetical protein